MMARQELVGPIPTFMLTSNRHTISLPVNCQNTPIVLHVLTHPLHIPVISFVAYKTVPKPKVILMLLT